MNNRKATKRALLTSVMALVMCVVMLVGTTFAWFTDTARASVNKIEAGKLDIDVFYADTADGSEGSNWTLLTKDSDPLSFLRKDGEKLVQDKDILWEPNCTYSLPALKIVNNGNLALKYKVLITGIQGNSELNDVIDWTMKLGDADFVMGSEHSLAAKSGDTVNADILTIQGHMDADAGNKYQGMTIEGVSITVLATQDTICRSRQLLLYFGEKTKLEDDCGICDVCIDHKIPEQQEIVSAILALLKDGKPHEISELDQQKYDSEKMAAVLEKMVVENMVNVEENEIRLEPKPEMKP